MWSSGTTSRSMERPPFFAHSHDSLVTRHGLTRQGRRSNGLSLCSVANRAGPRDHRLAGFIVPALKQVCEWIEWQCHDGDFQDDDGRLATTSKRSLERRDVREDSSMTALPNTHPLTVIAGGVNDLRWFGWATHQTVLALNPPRARKVCLVKDRAYGVAR